MYWVGWSKLTVAILTACLPTVLWAAVLKADSVNHDSAFSVMSFTLAVIFMISSFRIVFYIFLFWGRICFVRPSTETNIFSFGFLTLHVWLKDFEVEWIRKRPSLKQSIIFTFWAYQTFCLRYVHKKIQRRCVCISNQVDIITLSLTVLVCPEICQVFSPSDHGFSLIQLVLLSK